VGLLVAAGKNCPPDAAQSLGGSGGPTRIPLQLGLRIEAMECAYRPSWRTPQLLRNRGAPGNLIRFQNPNAGGIPARVEKLLEPVKTAESKSGVEPPSLSWLRQVRSIGSPHTSKSQGGAPKANPPNEKRLESPAPLNEKVSKTRANHLCPGKRVVYRLGCVEFTYTPVSARHNDPAKLYAGNQAKPRRSRSLFCSSRVASTASSNCFLLKRNSSRNSLACSIIAAVSRIKCGLLEYLGMTFSPWASDAGSEMDVHRTRPRV